MEGEWEGVGGRRGRGSRGGLSSTYSQNEQESMTVIRTVTHDTTQSEDRLNKTGNNIKTNLFRRAAHRGARRPPAAVFRGKRWTTNTKANQRENS